MKRLILLLLGLFLLLQTSWAQQTASMGYAYLDDYQFHKSRNFLLGQIKSAPNEVKNYLLLGETYLGLQQPDSAQLMFQKASELDPKSPIPVIGLGKVALQKGDQQGKMDLFEKARKMDKKNPEVYWQMAKGCLDFAKKDTALANKYINQGLELNSKYAKLYETLGDLQVISHKFGPATNAYENAKYFEPSMAVAFRKLGILQTMARANRDALNSFAKSIELNSDQILVYKNLGDLYYTIGKYAEAEKNYLIYLARGEVNIDDKERFAIILFFNKKYDEANNLLEEVMKQNADQSILLRIRGYIAYETQHYNDGLDYLAKFFKLHDPEKNIASDFIYYGRLLQKSGKDSLAIKNYTKALAMDSTKTELYDDLAKLYAKNNLHIEAADTYKKMMTVGLDKVNGWFSIGKEYYFQSEIYKTKYDSLMKLQKTAKVPFADSTAVMDLRKSYLQRADSAFGVVTTLNPQYAGGFMWRGRMNAALDLEAETTNAKDAYEKALAIFMAGDQTKNRKAVVEIYKYLGSYYFLQSDKLSKTDKKQSQALKQTSIEYWGKILEIDPTEDQALQVFKMLKLPVPAKK